MPHFFFVFISFFLFLLSNFSFQFLDSLFFISFFEKSTPNKNFSKREREESLNRCRIAESTSQFFISFFKTLLPHHTPPSHLAGHTPCERSEQIVDEEGDRSPERSEGTVSDEETRAEAAGDSAALFYLYGY